MLNIDNPAKPINKAIKGKIVFPYIAKAIPIIETMMRRGVISDFLSSFLWFTKAIPVIMEANIVITIQVSNQKGSFEKIELLLIPVMDNPITSGINNKAVYLQNKDPALVETFHIF